MTEVSIEKAAFNPPLLDAALRMALPELIAGVSGGRGMARVHCLREPSAVETEQIRQIVARHDASERTPGQEKAHAEALQRASLRRNVDALDLSGPLDAAALEKAVRWLLLREIRRAGDEA